MKTCYRGFHANLEKGLHYGNQIVKGIGYAKGIYEAGKAVYGVAQTVGPYLAGAAALA